MVFDLDRERIVGIGAPARLGLTHRTRIDGGIGRRVPPCKPSALASTENPLGRKPGVLAGQPPSVDAPFPPIAALVHHHRLVGVHPDYLTRCWRLGERGGAWSLSVSFCYGWGLSGSGSISRVTPLHSLQRLKSAVRWSKFLVTPLDEKQFRRGHFRAMARSYPHGFIAAPLGYFAMAAIGIRNAGIFTRDGRRDIIDDACCFVGGSYFGYLRALFSGVLVRSAKPIIWVGVLKTFGFVYCCRRWVRCSFAGLDSSSG